MKPMPLTAPAALAAGIMIAGCAATQKAEVASVELRGDQAPMVHSGHLASGDLSNLADGEIVAYAAGSDHALSRPDQARVQITTTISRPQAREAVRRNCDLDDDGVNMVMDDFRQTGDLDMAVEENGDNLLVFRSRPVELEPKQGVMVEFVADMALPEGV